MFSKCFFNNNPPIPRHFHSWGYISLCHVCLSSVSTSVHCACIYLSFILSFKSPPLIKRKRYVNLKAVL